MPSACLCLCLEGSGSQLCTCSPLYPALLSKKSFIAFGICRSISTNAAAGCSALEIRNPNLLCCTAKTFTSMPFASVLGLNIGQAMQSMPRFSTGRGGFWSCLGKLLSASQPSVRRLVGNRHAACGNGMAVVGNDFVL